MSRREQLAAVQAAETSLAAARRSLREHGLARIEAMRRVHPVLLLAGGVLTGIVTDRVGAHVLRSESSLSSGLMLGLRLLRLLPGDAVAAAFGPDG